jgi:hypothetical protein
VLNNKGRGKIRLRLQDLKLLCTLMVIPACWWTDRLLFLYGTLATEEG